MIFRNIMLYLILVIALTIVLMSFPILSICTDNGQEVNYYTHDFMELQIPIIFSIFSNIVALFLSKRRVLQIRVTIWNLILMLSLQILLPIVVKLSFPDNVIMHYELPFVLPLIIAIFLYLFFFRITRDEVETMLFKFHNRNKNISN